MKILIVCHYGLYSDFGNSFVHPQAVEYARLGHEVRALIPIAWGKADWSGSRRASTPRTEDGVQILPLRYVSLSGYGEKSFNAHSAIRALSREAKSLLGDFHPDVIHAHTLGFDSTLGGWLKRRYGCPLVVTTHGSDTSVPWQQGRLDSLKGFCDDADRVVGVSSALTRMLADTGTDTPLMEILNGFRSRFLPEQPEKVPNSFIQVGHLLKQKHFDTTICAFAKIRGTCPDATLTVIGQGPERSTLEQLSQSLGLGDSVRLLGQIPNREVLAEMGRHQYFVMPSVREGFGIVYLEAMANGCITIGTQNEGIADLIRDGYNGFLVPPEDPDAICRVVDWCHCHPAQTQELVRQGVEDARGLTWEKNARRYQALFEEVCL